MIEYEITAIDKNGDVFEAKTKSRKIKDVLTRELELLNYTVKLFKRAISLK